MEVDRKTRLQRELFLRVLVLSKPSPGIARAIAEAIQDVAYDAGATIFERGDDPDSQYWITSGEVDLVSGEGDDPWHFGEGAVIGILDVLLERPRARSAIAMTNVQAMRLPAEDWLEILEDNPEYLAQLRRDVPTEMHEKFHVGMAPDGGFLPPPEDDGSAAWLDMSAIEKLVALREVVYFERASVQALVELSRLAQVRFLAAGEVLFEPGGFGANVYVVCAGVIRATRDRAPVVEARFGRGQLMFGTVSMTDCIEQYGAVAESEAIVLVLKQSDVDDACEDHFDLARSIMRGSAIDRDRLMQLRSRRQKVASASSPPPAIESTAPKPKGEVDAAE
jgi:CRP/FNR family cyclic AMP-dependent transcriptional regulator